MFRMTDFLKISTDVANSVCKQYVADHLVCPPSLRDGLFTLAAFDNIDHNPSSATAQHSFHGTSMTLMQNQFTPSLNDKTTCTASNNDTHAISITSNDSRTISNLPTFTHR